MKYLTPLFSSSTPRALIGCLMLTALTINIANIVGRYIFLEPIPWAEEMLGFIMIWVVFIGAALVGLDKAHLKMDLFVAGLPSPWDRAVQVVIDIVSIIVGSIIVVASWSVIAFMVEMDQKSMVAELPMVIPHSAVFIGFSSMVLLSLRSILVKKPMQAVRE